MCSDLFKLKVPKVIKWYVFCQQCRRILFFFFFWMGGGEEAGQKLLVYVCIARAI